MDNQNTDNKIQQNEAQQPENATAQPAAEQGAEQTLGHGPQGVDAIALGGDDNVFSLQKGFQLLHLHTLISKHGRHVSRHMSTTFYTPMKICQEFYFGGEALSAQCAHWAPPPQGEARETLGTDCRVASLLAMTVGAAVPSGPWLSGGWGHPPLLGSPCGRAGAAQPRLRGLPQGFTSPPAKTPAYSSSPSPGHRPPG